MDDSVRRGLRPREMVDAPALEVKLVRLKHGYRPASGTSKEPEGSVIELPIEEARRIVKLGIAERADEF